MKKIKETKETKETNKYYKTRQENPAGTRGFCFLEYSAQEPQFLEKMFLALGFVKFAIHKSKQVQLWRQGESVFVINCEPKSYAQQFFTKHGPCVSAMGFLVDNTQSSYQHCVGKGAKSYLKQVNDWYPTEFKSIKGIGDSLLFLVDSKLIEKQYADFEYLNIDTGSFVGELSFIDHVTHNVYRGQMDVWADFYAKLFNFNQIRYFDIQGNYTGLQSRALTSPCGQISIPINEASDEQSQIEEYLNAYNGEGIQHIALHTDNIYAAVDKLQQNDIQFLATPAAYYTQIANRFPDNDEPVDMLQNYQILIDGAKEKENGRLLQIFTETCIGPVFFEIIQRKGDNGFGEGNFQALFESMELDQIQRGVLDTSKCEDKV